MGRTGQKVCTVLFQVYSSLHTVNKLCELQQFTDCIYKRNIIFKGIQEPYTKVSKIPLQRYPRALYKGIQEPYTKVSKSHIQRKNKGIYCRRCSRILSVTLQLTNHGKKLQYSKNISIWFVKYKFDK